MRKAVINVVVVAVVALGSAVGPGAPAYGEPTWEVDARNAVEGAGDYSQVHFWVCAPWEFSDAPFVVDYTTRDGKATAGDDYVATSGSLTFSPAERSRCFDIVVDTIDDDLLEGVPFEEPTREDFYLDLTTADFDDEIFGDAAHTRAYIYDDLDDWPMILDMTRATVTEGSNAGMVIWTPNPKAYPVTVKWETKALSADTDDFVASHGEVTIPPGENQTWISIPTIDDGLDESSETFRIVLSDNRPAEDSIISPSARGPITLEDNDPMPRISVEGVSVTLPEGSNGPVAEFAVSLNNPSGRVVGVDFASQDGTLAAGEDYEAVSGGLNFPPGVTSQRVTVSLMGTADDLSGGTLALTLDDPDNAALGNARATVTVPEVDDRPANPPTLTEPRNSAPWLGPITPRVPVDPTAAAAAPGRGSSEPPAGPRGTARTTATALPAPVDAPASDQSAGSADRSRQSERPGPGDEHLTTDRAALHRQLGGAAGAALALVIGGWTLTLGWRRRWFVKLWRTTS